MTNTTKMPAAKTPRQRRFAREPEQNAAGAEQAAQSETEAPASTPAPARTTKAEQVLALLRRADGATLAELVEATGWLPHTARAHLTGLRKKGLRLDKSKRGDATCYRIAAAG